MSETAPTPVAAPEQTPVQQPATPAPAPEAQAPEANPADLFKEEAPSDGAQKADPADLFKAEGDDGKAEEAPIEYDFKDIKTADGQDIVFSESDTAFFDKMSHELKLTKEQARLFAQKGGALFQEVYGAAQEAEKLRNYKALESDPELGGVNFKSTRQNLSQAVRRYAGGLDGEAYKVLESTGVLYHPAVLRMFNQIGKDISEEQKFVGNAANRAPKKTNPLRNLYNNSPDMDFGD